MKNVSKLACAQNFWFIYSNGFYVRALIWFTDTGNISCSGGSKVSSANTFHPQKFPSLHCAFVENFKFD